MDLIKNILVCGWLLILPTVAMAELWEEPLSSSASLSARNISQEIKTHQKARELILDELGMKSLLSESAELLSLSTRARRTTSGVFGEKELSLPLSDGTNLSVKVVPERVLPASLADKFNAIKTYRVVPDKQISAGRIDFGPNGFHALLQMRSGETFFIDPSGKLENNKRAYVSYKKQDQIHKKGRAFSCGAHSDLVPLLSSRANKSFAAASKSLLTYKIAVAATGEYVAAHGGTVDGAMAAIVTTINRVNQVYEQDLGIHLELVENNDQLIYIDAASDPFEADNHDKLIAQNQENTDRVIGSENYDLGHLFTTSGGGLAAIASVCNKYRKAQGVSGIGNPVNDSFNLDFVAHEIGHQLGATHTFNGVEGLCSGGTRESKTAFEPGSGSTIMSYAGYCGIDNLQPNTDAMLHIGSINQIRDFTENDRGNRCGTRNSTQNSPPLVSAGEDRVIPANTPFELNGTASDADNDLLVFSWEQLDSGERSPSNLDTGDNALFRVHMPNSDRKRSFPPIQDVVNHAVSKGEVLPIQQRTMSFSFVAQDSFNAAQSDEMEIEVVRTGSRFSLNMPRSYYVRGESQKILWNTASTNQSPINCDAVDVYLSTNNNYAFNQVLASNIPNTGETWVTIPVEARLTTKGRFKLACSNNIFFAVSYRDFSILDKGDIKPFTYADEDQPEQNLKDRILGESANISASNQELSVANGEDSNAAGGSMNWWLFGLLFLLIKRYRCHSPYSV